MPEIVMLAGMAAIGTAATYTAWPFLTGKADEREYLEAGPEEETEERLIYLEDQAHEALLQLDVERERGKISPQAHQSEKKRLQKGLRLIDRYLAALQTGRLPSEEAIADLEKEILGEDEEPAEAVLQTEELPAEVEPPLSAKGRAAPPRRGSRSTVLTCPACGRTEEEPDVAFCGRCGTALACSSCGQPIRDPEAAFCGRCGDPLRSGGAKAKK